ncbi:MAG: class I SAM-dependent methyltransferase [Betaproteobacteria bacterium]|nr:class I SAM-dependent methyltransferase [Betaproteobacteria bacterium]
MAAFKDHFSTRSSGYAAFRPGYPTELFEYLASLTPGHDLAWDCATGSGQAAQGLAGHYTRVWATDASVAQIDAAAPQAGVEFRLAPAQASGLPDRSVDLVTVAQAAHWFDLPAFYAEVRRVLKPDGLLAIWCYERLTIEPTLDAIVEEFYGGLLGPYWPQERRLVESGYRDMDFPFAELPAPAMPMTASWTLDQLLGYFSTWSALKAYQKATGEDPLPVLREHLALAWISLDQAKTIKWPLSVRLGRI